MRKIKINSDLVLDYLLKNKDRTIQEVYDFIKTKKVKCRSMEEHVVYNYLFFNRKKLGLK